MMQNEPRFMDDPKWYKENEHEATNYRRGFVLTHDAPDDAVESFKEFYLNDGVNGPIYEDDEHIDDDDYWFSDEESEDLKSMSDEERLKWFIEHGNVIM